VNGLRKEGKKMKKLQKGEGYITYPRMDWYYDEVDLKKHLKHPDNEKHLDENGSLNPHMEYYFDEISEKKYIRCPITSTKATVEVIRRASRDDTPFVDVAYCSIFGCAPTCKKECLKQINYRKHFHK
jgi:hypothetical protein